MNIPKQPVDTYPLNLLNAIVQSKPLSTSETVWTYQLPFDLRPSVEYAIALLSQRESHIIQMYFKYNITLENIAKEYDLTPSRIQQIKNEALQKLAHPTRMKYITQGIRKLTQPAEPQKETAIDDKLNMIIKDIAKISETLSEIADNPYLKEAAEDYEHDLNTSIDCLDLPVNALNCFKRHGIRTLRDLTKTTIDELETIRNLKKSYLTEVINIVHNKGLRFKNEKEL